MMAGKKLAYQQFHFLGIESLTFFQGCFSCQRAGQVLASIKRKIIFEVFELVIENKGYFKPSVFDFVDDYSRNPANPTNITHAIDTLDAIITIKSNIPMVGASGALFGVLIAFGMLFPNTQLFLLFPPMPVKAKYLVSFYGLYTIYNVLVNNPTDNVAHFAHLSGLLIGGLLVYWWKKDRNSFY